MAFKNENAAAGLAVKDKYQKGSSNVDTLGVGPEKGILLPWPSDPAATWVYFECQIMSVLDSGIVVHNRLPQVDNAPDTLARTTLDDPKLDMVTAAGINLRCRDQYQDIVQRMGHARYWFRLWGQALRVGYQVPIPGLKTVGGVPAIPYDRNPQWAYNTIAPGGNYGGVILWLARWSLWYTTAVPPVKDAIPTADPSALIVGAPPGLPGAGIQAPLTRPDDNAVQTAPPRTGGPKAINPNNR